VRFKKQSFFLIAFSIIFVTVFVVNKQVESELSPHDLAVSGLVDHPLNFTYNELQRFPMVSEVALMQCIMPLSRVLYNWTGIPLFFLLSITGVKPTAREVVFYASDNFSQSITIERALHPTTLIALQANGTVLSQEDGYPYRLVVPCKWGYKWVRWITKIEVVDYEKAHTNEDIPNCTFPPTTPPSEDKSIDLGYASYNIMILSNSTKNSLDLDISQKRICFNITGVPSTRGYCYVTIPRKLLWCESPEEWQVWVDNTLIEDREIIKVAKYTYLYFAYNHPTENVQIIGTNAIAPHDIGITWLGTSKYVVGQNFPVLTSAAIFNYGKFAETFNVTIYANTCIIAMFTNITLASRNSTTITFTWNTTSFAKGNYTIEANVPPIFGEIDLEDNTKTEDSIVKVGVPGDLNNDDKCNISDLIKVAGKFGAENGDPNSPSAPKYDPNYDMNDDGKINLSDLTKVATYFGNSDP